MKKVNRGFSLVELLVVIAVIGILASIALPIIANINRKSRLAKDQRNAQSLVAMASAAKAAGAFLPGAPDIDDVAKSLSAGVPAPTDSSLKDTVFQVPSLSEEDITGAAEHLEWDADAACLVYKPKF